MNSIVNKKRKLLPFSKNIVFASFEMLSSHDTYTKGHSKNVALLAEKIAKQMNLNSGLVEKAYLSGLVHDIGKGFISPDILNKKSKLTREDFSLIQKHPQWGYYSLKQSDKLSEIAKFVLYHHERWDGNGYPNKLSGNQIPLVSQILSVVDAWDAMTTDRSYRSALSIDDAISELDTGSGSQFSPQIVEVFLPMVEQQKSYV